MRQLAWFAAAVLAAPSSLVAQTHAPAPAKQVAPLEWLVGGTWTADASKMGGGMQRIETRYTWSDNSAYVRFTTHFVTDNGVFNNYDGSFFFDPAKSSLAMWYMDAANTVTQGPVTVAGGSTVMTWHGPDFQGKPADLRVTVARVNNDEYTWTADEDIPGSGWKQMATLTYKRNGKGQAGSEKRTTK